MSISKVQTGGSRLNSRRCQQPADARPIGDLRRANSPRSGRDTFVLRAIGGHDCGACCTSVGGNQQVVAPDWLSGRCPMQSHLAATEIGSVINSLVLLSSAFAASAVCAMELNAYL